MAGTTRKEWGNYYEQGRSGEIITNKRGVGNYNEQGRSGEFITNKRGVGNYYEQGRSGEIIMNKRGGAELLRTGKGVAELLRTGEGVGKLLQTGERAGDDEQGSEWGNCYVRNHCVEGKRASSQNSEKVEMAGVHFIKMTLYCVMRLVIDV